MAGRLDHLREWLGQVDYRLTQVVIVHDRRDEGTSIELNSIVSEIDSPELILKEGIFGTAASARNLGLSLCKGEWICFWDSDDQPNYDLVINGLDSDYDVIIGEFSIETPSGSVSKVVHSANTVQSLIQVSFNPGLWRMAFQARAIKEVTFPEIVMGEDQCFLAQLDWDVLRVKFTGGIFYNYFSGWESQTTSRTKSRLPLIDSLRFLQILLQENKGREEFTRNMLSRQFLTLFKAREFRVRWLAFIELSRVLVSLSGSLR